MYNAIGMCSSYMLQKPKRSYVCYTKQIYLKSLETLNLNNKWRNTVIGHLGHFIVTQILYTRVYTGNIKQYKRISPLNINRQLKHNVN